MTFAAIHSESGIRWHYPFALKMERGLRELGFQTIITNARCRVDCDFAVLLGTTLWRDIEATGPYLFVDRCSFGDTNEWVSLVWNGHGARGDHRVPPNVDGSRWERIGVPLGVWQMGRNIVLAGQTEPYSPDWPTMNTWYQTHPEATHFRPHPAQSVANGVLNLPTYTSFENVGQMITLNSSVAVEAILRGIPTVCDDAGAMAYPGFAYGADRLPWLRWLAWTQFHHDEIALGGPIKHLFDPS